MSEKYLAWISAALEEVERVMDIASGEYSFVITTDHGGHVRPHGTTLPVDMTIPLLMTDPESEPDRALDSASILDVAPTIADGIVVAPAGSGKACRA